MPVDAYIRFGKSREADPDRPHIEGDSYDVWHYFWCELRSCSIDLKATEVNPEAGEDREQEKTKAEFDPITIEKRVDWATTQLFQKCCEAPDHQNDEFAPGAPRRGPGWIDEVTVDICRQTGKMVKKGNEDVLEKYPFVQIVFKGVQVTSFKISISEPEPKETITFTFLDFDLLYTKSHPETGEKGTPDRAIGLRNYKRDNERARSQTSNGNGAVSNENASGGDGSSEEPVSTLAAAEKNFPGLNQGNAAGGPVS